MSDIEDIDFAVLEDEDSADQQYAASEEDYVLRRCSSTHSRVSVRAHLLRRDSTATAGSARGHGRTSQKIYMANEDLTIAVAGFSTSYVGYAAYILLCIVTCGTAYLLFRWLPRWYVAVLGRPTALKDCDWVVIENQWGELSVMHVNVRDYGRPVSSVFGAPEKMFSYGFDDDTDPLMDHLRYLDYRYVRLFFQPIKDKFLLSAGWKDPDWTDVRLVRSGLDSDEKVMRDIIFGNNLIDIAQKSVGQLLVDEVSVFEFCPVFLVAIGCCGLLFNRTLTGVAPILHISDCKFGTMVSRLILLLCCLHFLDVCWQYCGDSCGNTGRKYAVLPLHDYFLTLSRQCGDSAKYLVSSVTFAS